MSSKKKKKSAKKKVTTNPAVTKNTVTEKNEVTEDVTMVQEEPEQLETMPEDSKQNGTVQAVSEIKEKNSVFSKVAAGSKKVISSCEEKWNSLQKETRKTLLISSIAGIILVATVIVLAIRLGGVSKELEAMQAMSVNLQDELSITKEQMEATEVSAKENALLLEETLLMNSLLMATPTATPTPIPSPTPEPKKYIVCVDAGHGGFDGGAVLVENGVETRIEKYDNFKMSKLFQSALEEYNVEVVLTRDRDEFLELSERAAIANTAQANVLISFHRNSFDNQEVNGVEFWIHSSRPEGAQILAEDMLSSIMEVGGMNSRGVKYGSIGNHTKNYQINREANMTSMIVELGFITSDTDNTAYDTYGEAYAKGMAKAVYEWLEAQAGNEEL